VEHLLVPQALHNVVNIAESIGDGFLAGTQDDPIKICIHNGGAQSLKLGYNPQEHFPHQIVQGSSQSRIIQQGIAGTNPSIEMNDLEVGEDVPVDCTLTMGRESIHFVDYSDRLGSIG